MCLELAVVIHHLLRVCLLRHTIDQLQFSVDVTLQAVKDPELAKRVISVILHFAPTKLSFLVAFHSFTGAIQQLS